MSRKNPLEEKPLKSFDMSFYQLSRPVCFVGFMGAGKTSVARRLARMCHISSVDMDTYIERQENKQVSAIFAEQGEDGFRDIESAVLVDLLSRDPLLVSCGGGIVLRSENRRLLKEKAFVVFLQVSTNEVFFRISDISTRPLLTDKDNAQKINRERTPYYHEVAHAVVDTLGKDVARIAREVKDILQKERVLWQVSK